MTYFVEHLGDVEKDRRAQCAFLEAFHNFIDYPMCLLDRGMAGSKAKLVTGKEVGKFHIESKSLQEKFLLDLEWNGEKTNRAIGGDVMGQLTRFRYHYNLCKFP